MEKKLITKTSSRNETVQRLMKSWLSSELKTIESFETACIQTIVNSKSIGMRGLFMTAVCGMEIDKKYDPINNFYQCSPRAIFQEGVYPVLFEKEIPSSKDAPLGVAKATHKLDKHWISGKRDTDTASAIVSLLERLKNYRKEKDNERYYNIIYSFFYYLIKHNEENKIDVNKNIDIEFLNIPLSLYEFVVNNPNYGDNPEALVYFILKYSHEYSPYEVHGIKESVFSSNKNKPADLWITNENKEITNLYEVSVKNIHKTRLYHLIESSKESKQNHLNINIITLMPSCTNGLKINNPGIHNISGKYFNFIDLYQFIINALSILPFEKHLDILYDMAQYIDQFNIDYRIKKAWNEYFI